jgi:N-ethylmaleimide reductase
MTNDLFEPVTLGKLELPNRLIMAPMTRSRAARGGLATTLTADYYTQRAGAGLIISEGIQPSVLGQGSINTPGLHTREQVESWQQVTEAVHSAGGRIFAQLWHSGRIAHQSLYPEGGWPVAPSPVASGAQMVGPGGQMLDHPVPHELSLDGIAETIADFAAAARNAMEAGFDGVELHGANGYLIHQFLADNTNLRSDRYGGSIANRIRFALDVTTAVAEEIGPERTGLHISPGFSHPGINIQEKDPTSLYLTLVRELPNNLAYLHVMEALTRPITTSLRSEWPGALVLNPHPTPDSFPATPEIAADALRDGVADAVSLGTYWLANPDLPERVGTGGPYNTPDADKFYGGDHRGYTDYPSLSRGAA